MAEDIFEQIRTQVNADRVVLYMKGTPEAPQCGFSQTVCRAIEAVGGPYATYNVLDDPALREGIKQYSSWPTVPQLYVGGEFVGGCDIVVELYKKGELENVLSGGGSTD